MDSGIGLRLGCRVRATGEFGKHTTSFFGANADPVSAYLSDLYTVPASLAGLPGISVPCGIHSNGRPLGFQLLGETFSEARLLGVAAAWQRETDWHLRRPAGY